jgi:hypothetical protein
MKVWNPGIRSTSGTCAHLRAGPRDSPKSPMGVPSQRLDSWKAIADYLQRNVATVRRWEGLGLPVHRVPGGRGRSVFAYASEIDAWLAAAPAAGSAPPADAAPPSSVPSQRVWPVIAASLIVVAAAAALLGGAVRGGRSSAGAEPARVTIGADGIVAFSADGSEFWRYVLSPDGHGAPPAPLADPQILHGSDPGVLAATAYQLRPTDRAVSSGELLQLTLGGWPTRRFSFDDRVSFGATLYAGPWMISDFRVDDTRGARRIAVVAHHHTWWPSLVTVLDGRWRRTGTFVHAGWVEQVRWLTPDLLLIAGFSNAYDGGMVALLDARTLDGQAPAGNRSEFQCPGCGNAPPLRYITLPRSEVNRAAGAPFNRAALQVQNDRVVIGTVELPRLDQAVEAFYEFSPSLEPIGASFGDRYWEAHRALEVEGKIRHSRDRCPDRDGPGAIGVWEPETGWRSVKPGRR